MVLLALRAARFLFAFFGHGPFAVISASSRCAGFVQVCVFAGFVPVCVSAGFVPVCVSAGFLVLDACSMHRLGSPK